MIKYSSAHKEVILKVIELAEDYREASNQLDKIKNNDEIDGIYLIFYKPLELVKEIIWNIMGFKYYEELTRDDSGASFSYEFDEYFEEWEKGKISSEKLTSKLFDFLNRIKETYETK